MASKVATVETLMARNGRAEGGWIEEVDVDEREREIMMIMMGIDSPSFYMHMRYPSPEGRWTTPALYTQSSRNNLVQRRLVAPLPPFNITESGLVLACRRGGKRAGANVHELYLPGKCCDKREGLSSV